jgi:hypothetical protein
MALTPQNAPEELIAKMFNDDLNLAKAANAALARLEEVMHKAPEVVERFSSTNKRRNMVYDRIPVGHNTGYRCYDGDKHDADSAFRSGQYGDGMSEDEAYVDWLRFCDPELPATSAERELDESIDEGLDFDSGLTDEDARP